MIKLLTIFLMSGIVIHGPIDENLPPIPLVQEVEQPLYEGTASWYDYKLGGKWRSKNHSTCALRIHERYGTYKVCSKITGECISCYHNDYGPGRNDRVIDLSSYAFKQLGIPLSRGLTEVQIYSINQNKGND